MSSPASGNRHITRRTALIAGGTVHKVKPIFDEHEQQLPYDVKAVTKLFGPFQAHAEKQQGSPET
jgi:hypothetical protein